MIPHDTIDTLVECFEALSALGTEDRKSTRLNSSH